MRKRNKLCHGVGVNDASYEVAKSVGGKKLLCPFYSKWRGMIKRCYSAKCQARHQAYIGCSVSSEWLIFSNFKAWMEKQDWQGKELDKDILITGNKVYSAEACCFVDGATNRFIEDSRATRGKYQIGVSMHLCGLFVAQCRDNLVGDNGYLGLFPSEHQAHLAWKARKHELACKLADLQSDQRVAEALRARYL